MRKMKKKKKEKKERKRATVNVLERKRKKHL